MTTELTIERILESEGEVWGGITVNENIIVDSAASLDTLKEKMRGLAWEFENVKITDFKVIDITESIDF